MATGIMIMGSSGAGKTTLGNLVANELGYTFVDIDEYIWRKDTEIPFSAMYPKVEKISRLKEAISNKHYHENISLLIPIKLLLLCKNSCKACA